jgi:hypothetical protein
LRKKAAILPDWAFNNNGFLPWLKWDRIFVCGQWYPAGLTLISLILQWLENRFRFYSSARVAEALRSLNNNNRHYN